MTAPTSDDEVSDDEMSDASDGSPDRRARRRAAIGTWSRRLLPVVPVAAAIVVFVVLLQRDEPTPDPITLQQIDIATIATDDLESLIDTYVDDPEFADEIPGVQLILAERYFTEGAYDLAFELYAEVLERPETSPEQFAVSLSRVAWIAWLSNGDTLTALSTLDQSLRIDPTNAETSYIKGQILWCGAGETTEAIELFETVLRAPDLPDEVRDQVTDDLDAAVAGVPCR
jgi:tetratricopeptide (TPR) repeat protein